MTKKDTKDQAPQWVKLYVDQSEESSNAITLLRNSGYYVATFPISGEMGPELRLDSNIYYGLKEIEGLIYKK